jgi:ABC-type Fe3+/spermidine/putrescine transport system ATPase subunit
VIHGGRLQQYGTPQEVYAKPANRVVADFMGLVNLVPARVIGPGAIVAAGGLKLWCRWGTASARATTSRSRSGRKNIRLAASGNGARATINERTFLGNISEYYASLDSGPTLRVQTHPAQVFTVGDKVSIEIDAAQCSVFRSNP